MGKTGQFAEKQTAAVQSAGFEKFKTVMSKVNSVINLIGVWLFRLRKFRSATSSVFCPARRSPTTASSRQVRLPSIRPS